MKILYHHRIASKDGQFVHVEELTNALLEQGHSIQFVAPDVAENADFGSDGGYVAKLKRLLPGFLYELLELAYSGLIAVKLVAAIVRDRPDFIYERYNLFQPAGVIVARLFRLPLLLEVNAPLYAEREKYSGISLHRLARWTESYTWRNASVVLPVTQVLGDMVEAVGVDKSRIEVIHNGINERIRDSVFGELVGTDKVNTITIGFVGFLNQWHRIDIAVKALSKFPELDVRLLCVGDGDNNIRQELVTLAQDLGVADRVEFTGLKNREEVFQLVKQFDIALQPAVTAYASPLKMFEYLAAGCLILAPKKDNILEILNESNALLFIDEDFDDFEAKLRLGIEDIEQYRGLRKQARATIDEKNFTWQANARRVVALAEQKIKSDHR